MDKKVYALLAIILLITVFNLALAYFIFQYKYLTKPEFVLPGLPDELKDRPEGIAKFSSEDDFKDYLAKSPAETDYKELPFIGVPTMDRGFDGLTPMDTSTGIGFAESAMPDRVSETNVQVLGIDEPDIVKTDGKQIYFSAPKFYDFPIFRAEPGLMFEDTGVSSSEDQPLIDLKEPDLIAPMPPAPDNRYGGIKSIKAWPLTELKLDGSINKQGNLLLVDDILIVFENTQITGFDVSNPALPQEKWQVKLKDRNWLETARLYDNTVYLIARTAINVPRPCPYQPLSFNGQDLSIACNEIYHPLVNIPANSTYSILSLNPQTGEIINKTAFVGTSGQSVVYMSNNSVYVTYNYAGDFVAYILKFFSQNTDLIPNWVISRLAKLQTYDISDNAKLTEFQVIFQELMMSLSQDELLKLQNELNNKMRDYARDNSRELEKTGIVKINLKNLDIAASGNVPGQILNQFSLDEYRENLRIATTSGQRRFIGGFAASGESVNDVYVLDKNLKQIGAVLDMGISERIYSVRFIEDKGYVVTFRQIDPFYVLDLSKANQPELKGELKIPGYSSYLHPITKDIIIGIGQESGQVKISLFDVSNPATPQETAKYHLDDYYSEIQQTHHAFLLDDKHQIFFLPGSRGGYIFSYANNQIKLERAVSNIQARRAVYLSDYLYILGDNKIIVLDEKNWQEAANLEF